MADDYGSGNTECEPGEIEPSMTTAHTTGGIPLARPVSDSPVVATEKPSHEILLCDASRASVWADMGIVILVLVALELISQIGLTFATGIVDLPDDITDAEINKVLLLPALPARAALVTVVITVFLYMRRRSLCSVGLTADRVCVNVLLGLCAMGCAYALIIPWAIAAQMLDPEMTQKLNDNAEAIMKLIPRHSPLRFTWLALAIGFYEELFFRGFLLTRLRRALGSWTWATVVTTIVVVLPHLIDQNAIALVPISILSLVFSVVTIWRRSLIPAIVGHWLFNLSQFLGLYYISGDAWW